MRILLISAFAVCLAATVPTGVMADEHKDNDKHSEMKGGEMKSGPPKGGEMGGSKMMMSAHHTTKGMPHAHAHIDLAQYHKNFKATQHFHWGDYHAPPGYSYHHWGYGDHLPGIYFVQDYWINNYLNFGLMAPPDGYVWVRYGPDALLIDEDTGEVVQVEYDLFY